MPNMTMESNSVPKFTGESTVVNPNVAWKIQTGSAAPKTTRERLFELHAELTGEALELMRKKNHDYSHRDESPYANFEAAEYLNIHPVKGILLRQMDKIARLNTFISTGQLKVENEGVKDSILDLINYSVLAYGMIEEEGALSESG